mgnify:CR=1 FL=1
MNILLDGTIYSILTHAFLIGYIIVREVGLRNDLHQAKLVTSLDYEELAYDDLTGLRS